MLAVDPDVLARTNGGVVDEEGQDPQAQNVDQEQAEALQA